MIYCMHYQFNEDNVMGIVGIGTYFVFAITIIYIFLIYWKHELLN